jgi:hypothetical protein
MPKTLSEPYWYLLRAPPHSTSNIGSPSLGSSASTALFMRTLSWNRPVLVSITGRIFFHVATTFKLSGCFFDSSLRHYASIACRFGITFQLHCSLFHYFWACGVPLTCRVYWPPTAPPVERDATVRLDHTGPTALQSRIWFAKMFWKNSLWNALFPFHIFSL